MKAKHARRSRTLVRFLEEVLTDWFRDQAKRLGYAAEPRPRVRIRARKIVAAALQEAS